MANSVDSGRPVNNSARHTVSGANSTGLSTTWPTRQVPPFPPANRTGVPLAANAVSTSSEGGSTGPFWAVGGYSARGLVDGRSR